MVLDHVTEILAVTRASTWIWKQDYVSLGCHPLELVKENVPVGGVRPAMDIQNERIFFTGAKVCRLLQPRFNHLSVETLVMNLLWLGKVQFRKQPIVEMGQLFCIGAIAICHE